MQKNILKLAVTLALAVCGSNGIAQDYPTRSIKWIVPFLPGTAPDITVRVVGDAVARTIGQPVVIENRGGAGGNIGAQIAARAPADGYTWVYSSSPMATNMRMHKQPGFDVMKDFTHVGRISQSDSLIVVRPESGINSVNELIARLRSSPSQMSFASGGIGTPSHMGVELLLSSTGTKALHVPYKGASESTNAVVSQQVDFAVALVGPSLPYLQSGKLKPLAVLSPQRNALLREVPTIAEAGVSGFTVVSFGGLSVPKATPTPVVEKIRAALDQALSLPEVRTKLEATGATLMPGSGAEFTQALQDEITNTERVMKIAQISAQ